MKEFAMITDIYLTKIFSSAKNIFKYLLILKVSRYLEMTQINIRVNTNIDKIISYLASRRKVPKAVIARELLSENLTQKILPILLEDYQNGKIGIKNILRLTNLTPDEVMDLIAGLGVEPPITTELDDYTQSVADRFIARYKKEANS